MGGAILKAAYMGGLTKLGKKVAKENPDTKSPIGQVFVALAKQEKEKEAQKKAAAASADRPAQADRAAMAAPGAVEYAGEDTDEATPRRRRRQMRGRPTAGQRRSLLAEQSDGGMKTKLGG